MGVRGHNSEIKRKKKQYMSAYGGEGAEPPR